ncbi:MAG: hypothetical protein PHU34_09330 [Candidatus Methanoperedens sp.]|nr:hypothetical protein [Candidatus Methanoperedens sp.]
MNFAELHGSIVERTNQIQALQHKIPSLLTTDEKLKVGIAPEHKQRALEIAGEIKSLRARNERDSAILVKAQEISERYKVPLSEFHQLSLSIPFFEKQIVQFEERIETIKKTDPKKFVAEKDSSVSRIGQTIQKLEQARISLKNHQQARVEVEALLKEIEPQEAR